MRVCVCVCFMLIPFQVNKATQTTKSHYASLS